MKPLSFYDPRFEATVRNALQVYDRPLTLSDAEHTLVLDLSEFTMDTRDCETLALFRNLKELYLETHSSALPVLSSLTQLEQVYLILSGDSVDLLRLSSLRGLKDLSISGGILSSAHILHLDALTGLKRLQKLFLHEFGSVDLKPLEHMPQLTHFFCGYADHVSHLSSVSKLRDLTQLSLVGLDVDSLNFLDELPDTVFLDLCGLNIRQPYDLRKLSRFVRREFTEWRIAGRELAPEELP